MRQVIFAVLILLFATACTSHRPRMSRSPLEKGVVYNIRLAEEPNVMQAKIDEFADDGWLKVQFVENSPNRSLYPKDMWINEAHILWISALNKTPSVP
jgi:hypothetical protein